MELKGLSFYSREQKTERKTMKVTVDKDVCIGSGNCQAIAPKIFKLKDKVAHVQVAEVPEDEQENAMEALSNCPVQAISEE